MHTFMCRFPPQKKHAPKYMKRVNFTCEFCVFWVSGNLYITICIPFLGSMPMELYADRYMPPRASDHWELSTIAFLVQLAPMCDLATNLPGGESNPWFGNKMNMFTFWSVCATYWLFVLKITKYMSGISSDVIISSKGPCVNVNLSHRGWYYQKAI